MSAKNFPEELLVYVWQYQLFENKSLHTKSRKKVSVVKQGIAHQNSGPDFSNALIEIDNYKLAGSVEIHTDESEWIIHKHHEDKSYNNVVLHVVWESRNEFTKLENGSLVEVLELKHFVNPVLMERYKMLVNTKSTIACKSLNPQIDAFSFTQFLCKLSIERLERKVSDIEVLLARFTNDWDQVLFIYLSRYLGGSLNNDAMQMLAEKTPVKILYKNLHQPNAIEAILFGQSGLLIAENDNEYFKKLKTEYSFQKKLHSLESLNDAVFRFSKVRPAAFPTIRIAQLASVISSGNFSFENLLRCEFFSDFEKCISVSEHYFWNYHFDFSKRQNVSHSITPGKSLMLTLGINVLVPVMFAYGKYKSEESYCDKALSILESLKAESNSVVKQFSFLNINPENALQSQAMIQLKNEYCDKFRCLNCVVGKSVLDGK